MVPTLLQTRGPRLTSVVLALAVLLVAPAAQAIPRFAIRTGMTCATCHVTPTGGGMRTEFSRNVFTRQWLPMSSRFAPDVDLGEHVTVGGDLRAGYFYLNSPRPELQDTASFALMQADIYLSVQAAPELTFYVDRGVYGGFEAFALVRPFGRPDDRDLYLKAGRFVVPFGLRDVNHSSYVRDGIGFGPTDRDSGIEAGVQRGRTAFQAALTNGTFGDAFFDANGSESPHHYDLAVSGRFTTQPPIGPLRTLFEASVMYNRHAAQQNPLFVSALFVGDQLSQIPQGVYELRAEVGAGLSLGRVGYRGQLVVVRDLFDGDDLRELVGYTSLQTLSVVAIPGLEVVASYEFADADVEFARGRVERLGATIEWYPLPSLELSVMGRHSWGPADYLIGGARDEIVAFVHAYM